LNWDKSNPTIGGRTKIVQMVVGGMTQYLTAVQGMPKEVEEYLDKRIKKFVWAGKRVAPIDHDIMFLPTEEGGRDLLSIKNRNEAIDLKNLKEFLTREGDERAKYNRLRSELPVGAVVDPKVRDSPFNQTWKPLQKSLPRALKKMLKTAKNFRLVFDALAISTDLRENFPIFFHYGGNENLPKLNNSKRTKCLRDIHD
ncbi:hypothetical protein DFH08DRAFT_628847, partial [Mycena albidolilacea]